MTVVEAGGRRDHDEFDHVIVGAGSAGCVLADRLTRAPGSRVLLLEAGGSDRRFWIRTPIGYGRTFNDPRVNWCFTADADPGLDGRRAFWPRGRVVGGSSSINALVYCRGLPHDFDDWRDAGNPGWGWDDVRPWFEAFERRIDSDGEARGEGPLHVADVAAEAHPLKRHWFAAARELGWPVTDDFNGPRPEGVGVYAITRRAGLRCSAADAFLRPALRRGGVRLVTAATVLRVVLEGGRAVAVDYARDGRTLRARAGGSVILAAGAIGSPLLLQRSGIGPGPLLRRLGIEVAVERPAVGGNLQDHIAVTYGYVSREPTLNDELNTWPAKLRAGMRYVLARSGPLSLSVNQCGGFVRSGPDRPTPDLQLYFNPLTYSTSTSTDGRRRLASPDPFPGFILSHQPSRPTSRGRVDLASLDPSAPPSIHPNSLSTEEDRDQAVRGGRLLQAILRTRAMQALIDRPLAPDLAAMDDAAILADFRARAGTVYHPVGTCAMGPDPTRAVVDAQLRVHGVDGLRVIDASVFPSVTSGNTNAPTLMVAHKGAAAILGRSAPD